MLSSEGTNEGKENETENGYEGFRSATESCEVFGLGIGGGGYSGGVMDVMPHFMPL